MKIAILDSYNRDIGLKIIFPESDYYVMKEEHNRIKSYEKYNFKPSYKIEEITDKNYDVLILILCEYNCFPTYKNQTNDFFIKESEEHMYKIVEIINNNNFHKVCIFDNNDYDYDPTILYDYYPMIKNKDILFFKRNYDKTKTYNERVYPYPYIIFGKDLSMTELITETPKKISKKENRLFFSGTLFHHEDNVYGVIRNRRNTIIKIHQVLNEVLYNGYGLAFEKYMEEMAKSKFCLDLLGVGDPNRRTFEIFASGSLRIAEKNNLKWTWMEEDFCEETYFEDEKELYEKITKLIKDEELYTKCLQKQNEIIEKYMNKESLRQYILEKME